MREIRFRGRRVDTGEWVFGYYFTDITGGYLHPEHGALEGRVCHFILDANMENIEVIPETFGQYTGLRDCKRTEEYPEGQEIYEGDIVKLYNGAPGVVEWGEYRNEDCLEEREDFYRDCDGDERKEVGFYVRTKCCEYGIDNMPHKWIEVIGNVWEDGDILNDSKDTKNNKNN